MIDKNNDFLLFTLVTAAKAKGESLLLDSFDSNRTAEGNPRNRSKARLVFPFHGRLRSLDGEDGYLPKKRTGESKSLRCRLQEIPFRRSVCLEEKQFLSIFGGGKDSAGADDFRDEFTPSGGSKRGVPADADHGIAFPGFMTCPARPQGFPGGRSGQGHLGPSRDETMAKKDNFSRRATALSPILDIVVRIKG